MAIKVFGLESLAKFDGGRVLAAFDIALKRLERDCKDRPGLEKDRKLTLTVFVRPVSDETGALDGCDVQIEIGESIPNTKSKVYSMRAERGGLLFNEFSPEDARQGTLDELEGKLGPKGGHAVNVQKEEDSADVG